MRHLIVLGGLVGLLSLALWPGTARGELTSWMLRSGLRPERLLPLTGLGFALGLVAPRHAWAGVALWLIGVVAGYMFRIEMMALLQQIPGAITHRFLTLPIAAIAIGLTLAPGAWLRPVLVLPAALIGGAMYALAVKLSDPSYGGDMTIFLSGAGLGLWLIVALMLTLHRWAARWTGIAGRILGSWLITIGLLYAGVALMGDRIKARSSALPQTSEKPPAPAAAIPDANDFPTFGAPPRLAPHGLKPDFQP